jgi:hypothetical protein
LSIKSVAFNSNEKLKMKSEKCNISLYALNTQLRLELI